MLQTRKLTKPKDVVAVSFEPTDIYLRKSGRKYFGSEEPLVRIVDDCVIMDKEVAEKYGLKMYIKGDGE